jgi:PAS domain S-box-containing protein
LVGKFGRGQSVVQLSVENGEVLRLFIVTGATIIAILTTTFSLLNGIISVFPFHFILPIILVVYFYPERGVIFSLGLSLMYISLIYLLGNSDPVLIAIATAWFVIFIALGVVASSYAIKLREQITRVRNILDTSQDGIFCFDVKDLRIRDINPKCARWLNYDREDLLGKDLSFIWTDTGERERWVADIRRGQKHREQEVSFHGSDNQISRFVISAMLETKGHVLCSVVNITSNKIVDEEIIQTLNDLERQVKERTGDLERINEKLRTEILECRRLENTILTVQAARSKKEDI